MFVLFTLLYQRIKIIIITFFRSFSFFSFFFSGELVEAIARPICMKIGTNMSSCV